MSLAQRLVHGTIDFVGTSLPGILGFFCGKFVADARKAGKFKVTRGSNFATLRVLAKEEPALRIYERAVHVEDEDALLRLEDEGTLRDVEYVIQEHDADRAGRHFDLRLVLKGKAVSWAIPMKGKREGMLRFPKPGEKWMAVRQPDHVVEYNRFSGVIPKGQKGAGTVKIWARGTADVHKIEKGNVHFEIFSGPAKGAYTIVETKDGGLIVPKKQEAVELWSKPPYTKRDAALLAELEAQGDAVAERKVDGAAVEVRVDAGRLRTFSHRVSRRTGSLVEHSARLAHLDGARAEGLGGVRLRAEAWHPRGVNFLSGALNSNVDRARQIQRSAGPIRLAVFDITHHEGKDVRHLPYGQRRALYEGVVHRLASPHVQPVRQVKSGFGRFYEQQVNLKGAPTDGIVVKKVSAPFPGTAAGGRAAPPFVKVKPSDLADCTVVRASQGEGKHAGRLGALTCETPEQHRVQVGTGFSDWERKWIWTHRDEVPGEVARVAFHVRSGERTATGPRFVDWHPDKSDVALKMYADAMDVNPYALKSAAGWRSAA